MKKIKLLTPMLSIAALGSIVAPIATSCARIESTIVPTDAFKIVGYTLKGFKDSVDLSKYDTVVIPETVKFIDDNAFDSAFVMGGTNYTINTIVLPNTIQEIRANAFKGCNSIRVLDLSTWTADQIYQLTVSENAFAGCSKIGKVILNDNLTDESKAKIKALLCDQGIDPIWFADEATGKMVADAAWMTQKVKGGKNASYLFSADVKIAEDVTLYAQVTRTGSTKGVDVMCAALTAKGNGVYELPVSLMNHANDDDYAEFDVIIAAVKGSTTVGEEYEPLWKQTLTGFKLINIKGDTPEPEPEPVAEEIDIFTYTSKFEPIASTGTVDANDLRTILFEKLEQTPKLLIDIIATHLHDYYGTGGPGEVHEHEGKKIFKIKFENLVIHKDTKSYDAKITITQDFSTDSTNEGESYHQLTMVVDLTNAYLTPSFYIDLTGSGMGVLSYIPDPEIDELTTPIATRVTAYGDGKIANGGLLNEEYEFDPNDKYVFNGTKWNVDETSEKFYTFEVLMEEIDNAITAYEPKYFSNFTSVKDLITLTDAQKTMTLGTTQNKVPVTKAYTDVKTGDAFYGFIWDSNGDIICMIDDYDFANSKINVITPYTVGSWTNCSMSICGSRLFNSQDTGSAYVYTVSNITGLKITVEE